MNIVLFTERNSPYGAEFLRKLIKLEEVTNVLLITREDDFFCDYYLMDEVKVDVAELAKSLNSDVIKTENLDEQSIFEKIRAFSPSFLISANFQKKINKKLISLAKIDAINFHISLLPKYAGLAPFFWMIIKEEKELGVSCCRLNDPIDSGDIIDQKFVELKGKENQLETRNILFNAAYELFDIVMYNFLHSPQNIVYKKQNLDDRTYFSKPIINDMQINWNSKTNDILKIIRACSPYPGAYGIINNKSENITSAQIFNPKQLKNQKIPSLPGEFTWYKGYPVVKTIDNYLIITSIKPNKYV